MPDHHEPAHLAALGRDWIAAWNAHDLTRILVHCAGDFEMASPYIALLLGEPSGTLKGKAAVGDYWRRGLERTPTLHFELSSTLIGANSIELYYKGARGMAAEVFFFNEAGLVSKACAHYV